MRYFGVLGRVCVFGLALLSTLAYATPQSVRWTGQEDANADLHHVLDVIHAKTGLTFTTADFIAGEDRDLAFTHYKRLAQVASGVPLQYMSLRLWTDITTGQLIQAEAFLEPPAETLRLTQSLKMLGTNSRVLTQNLTPQQTMAIARSAVRQEGSDLQVRDIRWSDVWAQHLGSNRLMRQVRVKTKRGLHTIMISLQNRAILKRSYEEYPQQDQTGEEFSLPAQVYPIYELSEDETETLSRVPSELKYIKQQVARPVLNPYAALANRHYYESNFDPVFGDTAEGQAQGFWSMSSIKRNAAEIRSQLPLTENTFANGGVILEGRYATINLHPAAPLTYSGLNFAPAYSSVFKPDWKEVEVEGNSVYEMIPSGSILGKPIMSAEESYNRPARILADHNPVAYINDGFDEQQVYYAVNTMFDTLKPFGFTDPDLSTRPFHAFLFDPDISMKDNAFYTDDTINFTTYSGGSRNMARDNPTIWHELGHGVMDRLMGDNLKLADTGGLSEGMADFIAALVIQGVSGGQPFPGSTKFRIINETGFNLTNEVHDDGEAYGGAMKDLLDAAIAADPTNGLRKISDLVLETMRLCRDNPRLTANDWFSHMLFADELGRPGMRSSHEMRPLILSALAGRNFRNDGQQPAKFSLRNVTNDQEVTGSSPGSRNTPIGVELATNDETTYNLEVKLQSTEEYKFHYPVTVKVQLRNGPIQGAIHWNGEETQPLIYTIASESDAAQISLTAKGTCDYANRDDGSCVDYAYVQIWNAGEAKKPAAKKRFYLRIKPRS